MKNSPCTQTVLPDRSLLIGQKLVEIDKIDKFWVDWKKLDKMKYCTKLKTPIKLRQNWKFDGKWQKWQYEKVKKVP